MPMGLDEELMADQMNGLARSDEERRKRSLMEAMLGSMTGGGEDLATPIPEKRRLGPVENRLIASNPYDTLDSTIPSEATLQDQLAGMTLQHPEARDIPGQQRAKDEAALQTDLAAREKMGEDKAKYRTQSQATQRRGTDIRMRSVGDAVRGGDTMMALNDQLKPADNRLGGIRQAERLTPRDSRLNESFARKLQGSAGEDQVALDKEFNDRKARMGFPDSQSVNFRELAKKNARPQNLTDQQRENIALSKENMEKRSLQAALGLREGREGLARPENATPNYDRARFVGLDQRMRQYGPDSIREQMIRLSNPGKPGNGQDVNAANADERLGKALAAIMVIKTLNESAAAKRAKGDEAGAKMDESASAEAQAALGRMNQAGQPMASGPVQRSLPDALQTRKPKPVEADMQAFVKRDLKRKAGGRASANAPQDPAEWRDWFRQALVQ